LASGGGGRDEPAGRRRHERPAGGEFKEFPAAPGLATFDRSDRKFVAVACAHPSRPHILQATDAKWVGWSAPLARAGVHVRFVCEHEIRAKYEENFDEAKPVKVRRPPKPKGGRRRA
jgi:hypothetical protein